MTNPPDNDQSLNPYAGRYGQNPSSSEPRQNPYAGRYGTNPPGYDPQQAQQQSQQGYGHQQGDGIPMAPPVEQQYNQQYNQQYGVPFGAQQPPRSPQGYRVGEAVSYGWRATKGAFGTWLGAMLLVGALVLGILYATNRMMRDMIEIMQDMLAAGPGVDPDVYTDMILQIPAHSTGEMAIAAFGTVVVAVLGAGLAHMALQAGRGVRPSISHLVAIPHFTKVLTTVIFLQIIGSVLLLVPGMGTFLQAVASFFMMLAIYFVMDRNMDTFSAVGASMRLVGNRLGFFIVLALASAGLLMLGFVAFGVGVLVTAPIILCALAASYVVLSQQPQQRY